MPQTSALGVLQQHKRYRGGSNPTHKDTPLHLIQGSIHSDVMVYGVNKYGYGSPLPRVEMSAVWR